MTSNKEYAFSFRPEFYNLNNAAEAQAFTVLTSGGNVQIFDTILDQIKELIKLRNPSKKISAEEYVTYTQSILNEKNSDLYGVWVYYRWSNTIVHVLERDEFIEVRTSRNQYKITHEEREILAAQKIGVIGLSVGQSIAVTMAIERICGEIRLADFDTLELSNLNRLRSGVQNLGIPKVVIAAREIVELDPFLPVTIYPEGITDNTIDSFFGEGASKLNLLVEVCDGLDVKILSRYKAKKLGIPVVMDTNDKGMIDIERFDLHPDLPILHGLAGDLDPSKIKGLTNEEKIPYILRMIGADQISTRLKASMLEVEQTLNTWPQLASSVQLGGGVTTDICRRILLNQLHVSGRFYIDLEDLIKDPQPSENKHVGLSQNPHQPLTQDKVRQIIGEYCDKNPKNNAGNIPLPNIELIVQTACEAPSAGNNQPWKWYYKANRLFLLHDRYRSWSWGDYGEMGAYMSLGCALEAMKLKALETGYETHIERVSSDLLPIIAEISFGPTTQADAFLLGLSKGLNLRHTNRFAGNPVHISEDIIQEIGNNVRSVDHAHFYYTENKEQLAQLGNILAACDRIRLLHDQGHEEFYHEIRWNSEEAQLKKDGVDLTSINLTESEKAGFYVARDYNAIKILKQLNLGAGFKRLSAKSIDTASGIGIICIDEFNPNNLLGAGSAIMRAWITANRHDLSFYPMLSAPFFFNRLIHGKAVDIPEQFVQELFDLRESFLRIFPLKNHLAEVFLFRLAKPIEKPNKTQRLDLKETFFNEHV